MKFTKLSATCAMAIALGAPVHAETLRASTWLPTNDIHTTHAYNEWAANVNANTGGSIEIEVFPGGALMPPKAHLQGVGDGIAQIGFHASGYTPSDLPIANAISGMGFVEPDAMVLAYAFADFAANDPMGNTDFTKHGVVQLGAFSTPVYQLICNGAPIRTLDDLKGKRVRFPGGQGANLAGVLGITTVNIPSIEIYTALTQGQLDCTANDLTYLTGSQNLHEVSDSVTLMNLTPSFNSAMQLVNVDTWADLTEAERRGMLDATATAMARLQIDWDVKAAEALQFVTDKGHEVITPDASITEAVQAWVDAGVGDMAGVARDTYKVEDPDALIATFQGYLDKWSALINGMADRYDEAALIALTKENLFDKIDVATYGAN